jgi:uncharacterized repeat protein (TIGR03837 family)
MAGIVAASLRHDPRMVTAHVPASPSIPARLQWDIFCRVVDNLGDVGVCWRLSADLAARGQRVRLWIDQPEPLRWMAPGALEGRVPGVQVISWTTPMAHEAMASWTPGEVWVEAFGCDPAPECALRLADQMAHGAPAPVWINLEYLSAEPYVERSHRLPSPVMSGPLKGLTKWFFYPGFTTATGGLLREPDLAQRQVDFDAAAWLREQSLLACAPRHVSLFCYEPPALAEMLRAAGEDAQTSDWLLTPGRSAQAVAALPAPGPACRLHTMQPLPQREFDHLLWACDLNFVRGEDSLVRALWAGQPFVWQIYPQHDNAHHAKLDAFLDWLDAPASLRRFHHQWNGIASEKGGVWPGWVVVDGWRDYVRAARARLLAQPDLSQQLIGFFTEKR